MSFTFKSRLEEEKYWSKRYNEGETNWDIGFPSPPLVAYIDQLVNTNLRILIPGCGNAYEAHYLLEKGFRNVTLLDISSKLMNDLNDYYAEHTNKPKLVNGDYFLHQGKYDLILEQTFFCSLDPARREEFAEKTAYLLNPGGKYAGLFFNRTFEQEGPPFGGCKEEYEKLFSPHFHINTLEEAYNSIKPRRGTELFFIFKKKDQE